MRVLAVNTGSATLKCGVFEVGAAGVKELARTHAEGGIADVGGTLRQALARLGAEASALDAVGHRVVHGGRRLFQSTVIDGATERAIEELVALAPLHNPAALAGIRAARAVLPDLPMVAVFDTAFHAGRSEASLYYALPRELAEREGLFRYGFHGIAHASLVESLARHGGIPESEVYAVTLQLGQGCSACAVAQGRSVETSMGFTPLEGLPMGTRAGDVDPGLVLHLVRSGESVDQIEELLQQRSGLRGLCGNGDMREVLRAAARGESAAILARDLFVRRVALVVGAYLTLLDGRGAIVFGGGIGENSPEVRQRVCETLGAWDVRLDPSANERGADGLVSLPDSRPVYALRTDEERRIASEAASVINAATGGPE